MRKIKKLAKPQVLIDNAKEWTEEYCICLNNGKKPSQEIASRYNEPTIKKHFGKRNFWEMRLL